MELDITKLRYGLVATAVDGSVLHMDLGMRGVVLADPQGEIAQHLTAEFTNQKIRGKWLNELLPLGSPISFYYYAGEWIRFYDGEIWDRTTSSDPLARFSFTCYDGIYRMAKSKDDRYYSSGITGRAMILDTCKEWNIPVSQIDGPDVPLAKRAVRGQLIGDFFLDVLDESRLKGAGKFILRWSDGALQCIKPGSNKTIWHFGGNETGTIEDREDMDDLVTRVKVLGAGQDNARTPVEAVVDGHTEFGIIQDIVYRSQSQTANEAEEAAKAILTDKGIPKQRQTVEAPDVPPVRRGDKVHITAGTLSGYYIVTGIEHDPDIRRMTMEVETP